MLFIGCSTDNEPNLKATIITSAPTPYSAKPAISGRICTPGIIFHMSCPKHKQVALTTIRAMPLAFFLIESSMFLFPLS